MQQLRDDHPDAVDLIVYEAKLLVGVADRVSEIASRQIKIALDHGHGVVDLMRHRGGDLAHGSQFLGDDQPLRGLFIYATR